MTWRHFHLAQVNVAQMVAPLDSPVMAGFVAQLPEVNAVPRGPLRGVAFAASTGWFQVLHSIAGNRASSVN